MLKLKERSIKAGFSRISDYEEFINNNTAVSLSLFDITKKDSEDSKNILPDSDETPFLKCLESDMNDEENNEKLTQLTCKLPDEPLSDSFPLPVELCERIIDFILEPDCLGIICQVSKTFLRPTERNFQKVATYYYGFQCKNKMNREKKW